jgi:hypothetical protein
MNGARLFCGCDALVAILYFGDGAATLLSDVEINVGRE